MQNYPTGWQNALNGLYRMETKVSIAGVEYGERDIISTSARAALFAPDKISIGGCVAKEIDLVVVPKGEIPRMAEIRVFTRPVADDIETAWLQKGVFYIDTREEDRVYGTLTIHGYDAMLKAERTYLGETDTENWPQEMPTVVNNIAARMGVELDDRTSISNSFAVEYPADLTMREILGYIAAAHAGNWIMTDAGKLRLVPLFQSGQSLDLGVNATSLRVSPPLSAFSGVRLWRDDDNSVVAGNDTGRVLEADCPWATNAMANYVLSAVLGRIYQPYEAQGAILAAIAELGDSVKIDGVESIVGYANTIFDAMGASDIGAPADKEVDHEYPYTTKQQREFHRTFSDIRSEIVKNNDEILLALKEVKEDIGKTVVLHVDVFYYQSTSATELAGGKWSTDVPTAVAGKFIWTKNVVTYTDETFTETAPICISRGSESVVSIVEEYCKSASSAQANGEWSTTVPAWEDGKFIWSRSIITYSNGQVVTSAPVCVTGATGASGTDGKDGVNGTNGTNGKDGIDGIGVKSIVTEYYVSTSKTSQTGGSWSTSSPSWSMGKYLWTRSRITYTNDQQATTTPMCDSSWEAADDLKANIIAAINLSKEGVSIKGEKISLEGHISANGTFSVDKAGNMKATGGLIGGWTIKNNCLQATASAYLDPGQEEGDAIGNHILGISTIPSSRLSLYDFDGDGRVSINDYVIVKSIMLGRQSFESCPNARQSTVTITINPADPVKTVCISGTNQWGRVVEIFFGANINRSTLASKDYVNNYVKDNGSICDHLFDGSFSSGSITFPYSESYNFYLVQGIPASSMARVSLVVPRSLIDADETLWQITDDGHYMSFNISYSGDTVTMTKQNGSSGSKIFNIFGFR